ncbi:MAG: tetratricopeptide repeat protein, partial [Candidatus Paceibacterota bacterium]
LFTIGLFSKESQVIALGLAFLIFIFEYRNGKVKRIDRSVIFGSVLFVIFGLYAFIRLNYLNFTGVLGLTDEINIYTESIWVRLSTFVHILPEYFKMLVFPWHLYYEKPYLAYPSLVNLQSLLGLGIILFGSLGALWSLMKRQGYFFLGFFWFLFALIPVSGIIPVNSIYLEHWLYLPIVGIIFYLAHLYDGLGEDKARKAGVILMIIFVLFSMRIMARNIEWGNPVKFYHNELKYTQTSARIYNNLAMELADRGKCTEAVPNYQKAIELADVYPQTHHNLARCYEMMGKWEEAVGEYIKALQIQPDFSYSINALYSLEQRGIIRRE